MLNIPKKVVVIAPHPDDEVLGAGGTVSKLSDLGVEVSILIVSGHLPPLYKKKVFSEIQKEALNAFKVMNVHYWEFLKIPATTVHSIPVSKLNAQVNDFVRKIAPEWVFLPFPDRHIDHRTIFDASIVSCRPIHKNAPNVVLTYETLSETHWNVPGIEPSFNPDFFVDVSDYINQKKNALRCYKSQVENQPSRSVDACVALAKFRGSQNGCDFAEAFKTVRIVI